MVFVEIWAPCKVFFSMHRPLWTRQCHGLIAIILWKEQVRSIKGFKCSHSFNARFSPGVLKPFIPTVRGSERNMEQSVHLGAHGPSEVEIPSYCF